ncbi:nucleoside transporter [Roseivirga ehrenbergii]|uniref:MFS transporter n=1 Tax=Roseivirga ehrenbergii (strain DSM 102268 / JCM 13514 / KCTC 12282 / NCIMB 14502 / KMM 6017) TaxID=279360 RepID=A0A150XTV2_ROSEK|nr:nucleoside permease [Roseivirga ehrenbergii]KYG82104.1 MFS transporter [Roseivirga ehrenbergii]TCL01927.1 nucleoside transporter [Roseivirga ehrenbergii]
MNTSNSGITTRLSVMMFLQFFIWGGWFVTLGTFLGNNINATDGQIAQAFSTQSWGAIIAPFIIGLIADRYFNAEKILGLLHLAGAVLMYLMAETTEFEVFYPYVLGYMVLYMPTLALVNSVAFRTMSDPSKQFSRIRVWGTIGWVLAGLVISFVFSWDSQEAIAEGMLKNTFLMTAIASAILGVFSFTLPKTPPRVEKGEKITLKEILGLDALKLLTNKNFAVFFFSSVLICIPLAFYYQNANPFLAEIGVSNPTGKMTIGQISEVLFMLLLPIFLKKYGIKKTLLFGMLAWALRYVLFAFGNSEELVFMLITGIALHGICYDFFFVSGQIYTDSKAGEKFKSSAQGLITLATYGVGMLIGFWVAGQISEFYTVGDVHEWKNIWLLPAGFAVLVFLIFAATFKNEEIHYEEK